MAAASRTALGVAFIASLSPEAGCVEPRPSSCQAVTGASGKSISSSQWVQQSVISRPFTGGQIRPRGVSCAVNANDVAVSTAPATAETDGAPVAEVPPLVSEPSQKDSQIQETSVFISDVANLIKLVDSRDIVELELKHKKYEIVIRKKEALKKDPPTQSLPGPHIMGHTPWPQFAPPASMPAPAAAPAPAPAPPPAPAAEPAPPPVAAAPAAPAVPAFVSPMAGTFYRSPAPGEPPFIKIGDKVQKGQVVCIIEAMKLMNEIEADQSGTLTDILVPDSSGVAIDTPLFLITP